MDKSKWEYKKLGEVCIVVSGSTPKTQVEEYWNGNHYWITPAELDGSTYVSKSERLITDAAIEKTNLTLLPVGTVLLSSRAPIGKVAITTVPMYCNQGFKNLICSEAIYNKYLYWFLKVNTEYLNSLGRGATFKEISKTIVENIKIPVYSIADQQRIVAELDCLNEMIALKQEQLKEFDKLAQSIFYDMFGDPITNEKGWRVDVLNSVCDVRDGTHDSPKYVEDGYPLITSKNVVEGDISFDDVNYISEDDLNAINARSRVDDGDIIMPMIGTIGKPVIVHKDREFAIKNVALIKFEISKVVLNIFIQSLLNSSTYSNYILSLNKGGTQKFVSLKTIRNLPIILPPLALQQEFAEKIQAIEAQKELVKQSIAETQQLLDSRMDYYFD